MGLLSKQKLKFSFAFLLLSQSPDILNYIGCSLAQMSTIKNSAPSKHNSFTNKSANTSPESEATSSNLAASDIRVQLSEQDLKSIPRLTVIRDKIKAELEANTISADQIPAVDQVNTLVSLKKDQLKQSIKSAPSRCEDTEIKPSDLHNDQTKIRLQLRQYLFDALKEMNNDPSIQLTDIEFDQLKQDMAILLTQLRNGTLPDNLLITLTTTIYNVQKESFQQATSSYLQLSIGNVAWPMGVKATNIHSRKGDDKITKGSANISKNDGTERWLLALKRVITYREKNHAINKRSSHQSAIFP
ncbi:BA75_03957T0 [Komagataella pastoris]|uniref:Pre-mRNA-splicing factor 18 n=1 Tax=Komagataella pastoris TaxID=4922 RepID=A0A1B2JGY1_PICPA|nr:BA75_03957T0 [Komagataella pastoris]